MMATICGAQQVQLKDGSRCFSRSGNCKSRHTGGFAASTNMSPCLISVLVVFSTTMLMLANSAEGAPLPAANMQDCNSEERCCMPRPYTGKPIKRFQPNNSLPMKIRRPAHLVDDAYIAKYEKAYEILRALPDSDPRSLLNQKRLHCLYCDNGIYYPNMSFPLEIHNGWLFLPWHRMFIYFHERILAKLLGDDAFALPYWNWDNQTPTAPYPNIMPHMYAKESSSLWDPNRNKCAAPSNICDLNSGGGCTRKPVQLLRAQNNHILYTQLVTGATTPSLLFGMPYRLGDVGGLGPGTLEDNPHGTVHAWVGDPNATTPFDDMGNFGQSARDPIFYTHHTNIDRIWTIWKTLPGGIRKEPTHPDFLDSQFTYYDEDANLVSVRVGDILDIDLLRYEYESQPTPWTTNGQKAGDEDTVPYCNPTNPSQVYAMIASTPPLTAQSMLFNEPLTFRVHRPGPSANGTEVLEIQGIGLDATKQAHLEAYLFYPSADGETSVGCPEFFGTFNFVPHIGQALYNPARVWRAALGPKLRALGKDSFSHIIVTFVQVGNNDFQPLRFKNARIVYDMNLDY